MERLINFDPQWINDVVITGINIFILFFAMSYLLFNPASVKNIFVEVQIRKRRTCLLLGFLF